VGIFISTTGKPNHMQEKKGLSCGSAVIMLVVSGWGQPGLSLCNVSLE